VPGEVLVDTLGEVKDETEDELPFSTGKFCRRRDGIRGNKSDDSRDDKRDNKRFGQSGSKNNKLANKVNQGNIPILNTKWFKV
jgi:hypothetical protein